MIIAPSILSADFSRLIDEVKEVEAGGAEFLHIDVMDGHFVPNITIGPVVYKYLKGTVDLVFDVHLMISDPKFYAESFISAGADILTFHYEAVSNPKDLIDFIRGFSVKVGMSVKPATDIKVLDPYLKDLDLVLVMSVEPGFGGQSFLSSSLPKLRYLSEQKQKHKYRYVIEVDGGINLQTARLAKEAGAEVLVAGTYIFGSNNRKLATKELLDI